MTSCDAFGMLTPNNQLRILVRQFNSEMVPKCAREMHVFDEKRYLALWFMKIT